ncbi:MAG: BamA/TamA family outer membrane protein [Bacteroidia bacterium]
MFKSPSSKLLYSFFFSFFIHSVINGQALDSVFRVDSIYISGNNKTKTKIILREISFKLGDTIHNWSYHKEQSRKQLINLYIFNEVSVEKDGGLVTIHVTERWYIWPIPQLDYADRNFNQWWLSKDFNRLIYGVNLEWYNIRGRNETMTLRLLSGYTKMAAIKYKIPYFNKKQTWGLQVDAHYSTNREVWYKTEEDKVQFFRDNDKILLTRKNAELTLTHRKKIFSYHNIFSGIRQTNIADTVATYEVNRRYLLNNQNSQTELYLGYHYIYDRRDFKGFPLKGNLLKLNIELSQFNLPSKNLHTLSLKGSYSKYFPIFRKLYGSFHGTLRYYSNDYPPYSKIQALGYGKDYIRGYELNVIDGNNFALGKAEIKYQILDKKYKFLPKLRNYEVLPISVYLSSFYDLGYVQNAYEKTTLYSNNILPNSLQRGGGVGINFVMFYDYCTRIEYAADKFLNRRFYISFVASM